MKQLNRLLLCLVKTVKNKMNFCAVLFVYSENLGFSNIQYNDSFLLLLFYLRIY